MTRREVLAALLASPLVRDPRVVAAGASVAQAVDPTTLTVAQASAALAKRQFTPLELANAYLARIDGLNPDLNAYITVTRDLARQQARNAAHAIARGSQAALTGIPIAHKDLFETNGVRTTAGSLLFEYHTPQTNAAIVQQLENAGAVMLGKTNTHELGGGVTTINPFFGTTRNPADRTRIPGGSSGGSAAAVAARLCAAATGSDTGGSVRIPAAFCGCVGFKPTHGRISTQGLIAASSSFDHVGFLTRTVEDAQILFHAATGTTTSPSGIRIGVARHYFFDGLEPQVAAAVDSALASSKQRATLTEVRFPISEDTMSRIFDPVFMFELWHRFGADWRTNPGSFSEDFSEVFALERPSVTEYETGLAALEQFQQQVDRLFDEVDVIATPTVSITAPAIGGPIDGMRILRNTWPFNAAGTPAISIPIADTRLPVGLQLIARRGDDDKLLQIASRLS